MEIKEALFERFEPLTIEEQKIVFRAFINMYLEMSNKLESKNYTNESVVRANLDNYSMIIGIFSNNELKTKEMFLKLAQMEKSKKTTF